MKPEFFDLFIAKGLTLGCAESITGGLFSSSITQHPSASLFFKGGWIVYSNEAKVKLGHIKEKDLVKFSAISKEIAQKLAYNVMDSLQCDVGIAFVGNAGPTAQDNQPIGSVYMAIASKQKIVYYHDQLQGDRNTIQQQTLDLANERLVKFIQPL